MTSRSPRTLLGVASVLLIAVLAVFAIALARSASNERSDAEQRFKDRARVSAALTESLFTSTTATAAQQAAERFGDRTLDTKALDREVARNQNGGLVILDAKGAPISASTGTTETAQAALARDPQVGEVVRGVKPLAITDYIEGTSPASLASAIPFETDFGRRISVSVFPADLLAAFLGGYLKRIPGAEQTMSYVLDSKGRVVGSPVADQAIGGLVEEPGLISALKSRGTLTTFTSKGVERAAAQSPVANSTWRVVLTQSTEELYAGTGAFVEWLILVALALAGGAATWMLARSVRAAIAVQDANQRLELANAELAQSNVELQRSNSELEQFASVASHDLQEPLRKVQTFGDQIERRFGEEIPEEGLDYLRRMRAAAGRMSVLIDDLLRFSRVTTRALPPEPVDLAKVAAEVTSDLEAPLQDAHGTVTIGDLPTIEADPLQMRQLLQNLIANAIKFQRLDVPPVVDVDAAPGPTTGTAAITVSDNGIGMEERYQERVFRVFERLHPRDVYPGTGIGLALCRKIVERHGGTVTVASKPDQGSRFTVVLPLRQPRHLTGPYASAGADADGHTSAAPGEHAHV